MSWSTLLFGILPLIIFVLIDSFAGVKAGVMGAVFFALLEMVYTLVVYGKIDEITLGTFLLVVVFGVLSYRTDNPIFFKLQPVVFGVIVGVVLLVMQALDKPLLVMLMEKYQYMFPEEARARMLDPFVVKQMARVSGILGWGFLLHAGIVGYAAFYMSSGWWLFIRGIGFYGMVFICGLLARYI